MNPAQIILTLLGVGEVVLGAGLLATRRALIIHTHPAVKLRWRLRGPAGAARPWQDVLHAQTVAKGVSKAADSARRKRGNGSAS